MCTGDVSSGKSTLIDRLCQRAKSHPIGAKFPLSGCSLEYRFIDVQDEDTDGEREIRVRGGGVVRERGERGKRSSEEEEGERGEE